MTFTIEQQLDFSTNWKKYHEDGLHRPKEHVISIDLPPTDPYYFDPQIHMVSDLSRKYHIMYSFLRNLPLDRGLSGTDADKRDIFHNVYHMDYWRYNNRSHHYERYSKDGKVGEAKVHEERLNTVLEAHQTIFGKNFTLDIIDAFLKELKTKL